MTRGVIGQDPDLSQARYPEDRLDVDLSGRKVNPVDKEFALTWPASAVLDPGLIGQPLMDMPFLLVTYLSGWRRRDARIRSKTIAGQTLLACSMILIGGAIHWNPARGDGLSPSMLC